MNEHDELRTVGPATAATVAYKGWITTIDGREAIELVLPLGAPPDLLDQAIEQWHTMRAAARTATRAANAASAASADPGDLLVSFGKYSGMRLREIAARDRDYVEWLSQAARDLPVREAALAFLGIAPDRLPAASAPADAPPF